MTVFHVHLCDIKAAGGRHLRTSREASLALTKTVGYLSEPSKTTFCPDEIWEYVLRIWNQIKTVVLILVGKWRNIKFFKYSWTLLHLHDPRPAGGQEAHGIYATGCLCPRNNTEIQNNWGTSAGQSIRAEKNPMFTILTLYLCSLWTTASPVCLYQL